MLIHVVDPSAYTPPYDDALCRALAAEGAQVELYTSRFAYGERPQPSGYSRRETFYRAASRIANPRARRAVKLIEHAPGMLAYRRAGARADVVHFQWLPVQQLDSHLLPRAPLVLTAHDVLPREPVGGQRGAQRRLYERMDAVVAHTEHGRGRLVGELGLDPERVHVIPHGVLRPWQGQPAGALPRELVGSAGRVVLFFGLLRPYKGLDVLLDAWHGIEDAELWIVGMPRMPVEELRRDSPPGVRWLTRFVSDAEMHAVMDRADLLVAPYREIEQSGVVFTALGAGLPAILSDVGGFPELADTGAVETVPAGDAGALQAAIAALLADSRRLARMAAQAANADHGARSWTGIAQRSLTLYEDLLA